MGIHSAGGHVDRTLDLWRSAFASGSGAPPAGYMYGVFLYRVGQLPGQGGQYHAIAEQWYGEQQCRALRAGGEHMHWSASTPTGALQIRARAIPRSVDPSARVDGALQAIVETLPPPSAHQRNQIQGPGGPASQQGRRLLSSRNQGGRT
jgi:hypothetical protein